MKLTVMGSGTSHGIPVIACDCDVCKSSDIHDKRLRCSVYVEAQGNTARDPDGQVYPTTNLVIDTGPEFRIQCLKYNVKRLDGVLITHSHADHCHGLDDLRIFSFKKPNKKETPGDGLPIYCNSNTLNDLIYRFAYIFKVNNLGGGIPKLNLLPTDSYSEKKPFSIGTIEVLPVPMMHGYLEANGFVLRDTTPDGAEHAIAYLTDCSHIPDLSLESIKAFCGKRGSPEHLIIDGLRKTEHWTHCNFDKALFYANQIGAAHTWLTHITHETFHTDVQNYINAHLAEYTLLNKIVRAGGSVAPAYDGLQIEV
jgi:phosphoribosyl 1,2-cyclic phosphate phosphodiesterase